MTGGLHLFLLVACVTFASHSLRAASNVQVSLDAYAADPAGVVARAAASDSLPSIVSSLRRHGPVWMLSHGAGEANQRRLIAATFALEVAATGLESAQKDVPPLIEWGCEQMRRRLPSDAERQWHIAALALLEGLGNLRAVETHLAHASARLADEPMWDRTRVWLSDSRTLHVHPRQPLAAPRIEFPTALAVQYQALTNTPSLASDAWLRLGFLHFLAGDEAAARSAFTRLVSTDDTPADIRYLTHLFSSWMDERHGRHDDAIRELRAAVSASPSGRTAATWLAARYQIAGRALDAQSVAVRALEPIDGTDPWRLFYRGDLRRWPELITRVRKAVQ